MAGFRNMLAANRLPVTATRLAVQIDQHAHGMIALGMARVAQRFGDDGVAAPRHCAHPSATFRPPSTDQLRLTFSSRMSFTGRVPPPMVTASRLPSDLRHAGPGPGRTAICCTTRSLARRRRLAPVRVTGAGALCPAMVACGQGKFEVRCRAGITPPTSKTITLGPDV